MATLQAGDHLSALFASQLSLQPTPPPEQHHLAPPPPPPPPVIKNSFPSAHYTPTRHMVPIRFSPPPDVPEPIPDMQVPFFLTGQATLLCWTPTQLHTLANVPLSRRLDILKEWGHVRKDFFLPESSSGLFQDPTDSNLLMPDVGSAAAVNQLEPLIRPASAPESRSSLDASPEPYMASGYEMLARREYEESISRKGAYVQRSDPAWNRAATGVDEMEF